MQGQRSAQDDAEYRRNWTGAEYINALYALDNGWDGHGVLVGVIDTGVVEVDDLKGQLSPLSKDFGFTVTNGVRSDRNSVGDELSTHGTSVAAIIAAKNDGVGVQGLAPGAKILAMRVDQTIDGKIDMIGFATGKAIDYAIANGVKIINMSLGKGDPEQASSSLQESVTRLTNSGGLLIQGAGNDAGANPAGYIDLLPSNSQGWMFVAGLEPTGTSIQLASYSNKCGVSMDRCVTAVAGNVTVKADGNLTGFLGTSSATPQVSSLAAMILSKWPQLSGVDAGNVILATARDIGDPGVDKVYGHGLIDVKAALSPVNPTLSNGTTASAINGTYAAVNGAFGDAGGWGTTAYGSVTVLDQFGRDFSGDLSGLVVRPASSDGHWLRRRLEAQGNAGASGFITPKGSASLGYTSFRFGPGDDQVVTRMTNADFAVRLADGTHVVAGFNSTDNVMANVMGLAPTSDVMFAYSPLAQTSVGANRPFAGGRIGVTAYAGGQDGYGASGAALGWNRGATSLKLGLIDENGTVFGTPTGAGAMRFGDGARTAFAEIASGFELGRWGFDAYASMGATQLKLASDMLLTNASTIASGRFGLIAGREAFGGRISLGLAQPLVALAGSGTVTVGDGYDYAAHTLSYANRRIDMAGTLRPQLTAGFEKVSIRSAFRLGAASDLNAQDLRAVGSWTVTLN